MHGIAIRMTRRNHNAFVHLLGALEAQGFDIGELLITKDFAEILKARPKVVLYSFFTEEIWDVQEEVKILKENTNALLVAGGYHATAMPKHTLNHLGFDIAAIGEGEEIIFQLLSLLKRSDFRLTRDLLNIQGLAFYLNDEFTFTGFARVDDFTKFPPFAESSRLIAPIEISRGCPFGCYYCQTPYVKGFRMRHRPIDQIVKYSKRMKDMRYITPNAFAYGSPGAILNLNKLEALLKALQPLREEGRRLFYGTFPSEVRPEFIKPETLELLLKYADNRRLAIGAQSGDDDMLRAMHRVHTTEHVKQAVEYMLEYDIEPVVDFIVGLPNENEESQRKSIEFMKWIMRKGGKVRAHYFMPLPGTPWARCKPSPLSEEMKKFLGRMAAKGYIEGSWGVQIELSKKLQRLIEEFYEVSPSYVGEVKKIC
ncbi:TIGR04013 family B12-binding domain/radical SAM domain-containing protein [Thermococcus argininiproducens]|uniref:TIGR04013 family B12-binding domain/radical SAM domain-containing protein n=1 Tax=Thermococcus argininiproducens TaxID=2866384 RepID=A0A9E7SCP8_9EURY|nr:TIGR04013 family B12-binding domain/radical SAM domain-containing protein [Thermococcus argininiproducens]USH00011.1 TIGR04013 family B12-binding domain/radical SAM domain-containing protein [Thermococcus argininiproducens]